VNQQERESLRIVAEFAARTPEHDDNLTHTRRLTALEQCAAAIPRLLAMLAESERPPITFAEALDALANLAAALPCGAEYGEPGILDLGRTNHDAVEAMSVLGGADIVTSVYSADSDGRGSPYVLEVADYRIGSIIVRARRRRDATADEAADVIARGVPLGLSRALFLTSSRTVA
jgi:hypothetical protein